MTQMSATAPTEAATEMKVDDISTYRSMDVRSIETPICVFYRMISELD